MDKFEVMVDGDWQDVSWSNLEKISDGVFAIRVKGPGAKRVLTNPCRWNGKSCDVRLDESRPHKGVGMGFIDILIDIPDDMTR